MCQSHLLMLNSDTLTVSLTIVDGCFCDHKRVLLFEADHDTIVMYSGALYSSTYTFFYLSLFLPKFVSPCLHHGDETQDCF
jgi:hypothetical protein